MRSVVGIALVALAIGGIWLSGQMNTRGAVVDESKSDGFGAALSLEHTTPLVAVLDDPDRYAKESVLIRGRLTDVCQRKGCWTVVQDQGREVRVTFKDYGFFLPKDSIGREAFAEGVVEIETLSEADARHYESESSNGDPDSIQGPQRHVGFVASGVRLVRR